MTLPPRIRLALYLRCRGYTHAPPCPRVYITSGNQTWVIIYFADRAISPEQEENLNVWCHSPCLKPSSLIQRENQEPQKPATSPDECQAWDSNPVFANKLLRGRVETQGDMRCGEASLLHKLASLQNRLLEREPHGEKLSRVEQTRKNGVCTSVRRCVGECERQAGDTTKPHALQQV